MIWDKSCRTIHQHMSGEHRSVDWARRKFLDSCDGITRLRAPELLKGNRSGSDQEGLHSGNARTVRFALPWKAAVRAQFTPGQWQFYSVRKHLDEIAEGNHGCTGSRRFASLGPLRLCGGGL